MKTLYSAVALILSLGLALSGTAYGKVVHVKKTTWFCKSALIIPSSNGRLAVVKKVPLVGGGLTTVSVSKGWLLRNADINGNMIISKTEFNRAGLALRDPMGRLHGTSLTSLDLRNNVANFVFSSRPLYKASFCAPRHIILKSTIATMY